MNSYLGYVSRIDDLEENILRSLEFIKWKRSAKRDSTVFVKPNFTFPYFEKAVTTNPELLRHLLGILKDRCDNVAIGESDGGYHSFTADEAFKGHGMQEICRETGVELLNLSKLPSKHVEKRIQGKKVRVKLPRFLLDDVDCFISVSVLKVHVMTGVSLCLKNLWGCHPDTMRCLEHKHLSNKLTLIAELLNPEIALIDGIYALDNHGPMYGEVKKTDLLIASNNPVVADSLGAAIMGVPLAAAKHILVAEKHGLGTTSLGEVTMNDSWKKFEMEFRIQKTLIDTASRVLFDSETLAKLVMDSPVTPIIYKMARLLRTPEEKQVADRMMSSHGETHR